MNYEIKEFYPHSRHGEIGIFKDDKLVVKLTMRPYFFYKKKKLNFTDDRVPLCIDMHYGSVLCSENILGDEELHDAFINGIRTLFKNVNFKCIVLFVKSEELYNFYSAQHDESAVGPEDCIYVYTEESKKLLRKWGIPGNHFNVDNAMQHGTNSFGLIIKKEHQEMYMNGTWWDKNLEIREDVQPNETT